MSVVIGPIERDVRDRLGEAVRLARYDGRPDRPWLGLSEARRAFWRSRADILVAAAAALDVDIGTKVRQRSESTP